MSKIIERKTKYNVYLYINSTVDLNLLIKGTPDQCDFNLFTKIAAKHNYFYKTFTKSV